MNIAIIGAGPRGLALAHRLLQLDQSTAITINLFDPFGVGGRVWNPKLNNNQIFLMNTVADQVTLFNDASVDASIKGVTGPNLLKWSQEDAADYLAQHPDYAKSYSQEIKNMDRQSYSSRGLMGVYAHWFFDRLKASLKPGQELNCYPVEITKLQFSQDHFHLITSDETQDYFSDVLVMAPGHLDAELSGKEKGMALYADAHHLQYWPMGHPAEANFSTLAAKEPVLMRGFGLSFFDYMIALTEGRGGHLKQLASGELKYVPSGKEPTIYVGSRSGFPPRSRGINQKDTSQLDQTYFFTLQNLEEIRAAHDGKIPYDDFFSLLQRELSFKYLSNKIEASDLSPVQQTELIQALMHNDDWTEIIRRAGFDWPINLDLKALANPVLFESDYENFQKIFEKHLEDDIASAKLGNEESPLTAAFDLLRDVRSTVRFIIEHDYFTPDDYQRVLNEFKSIDARLSVGPPVLRTEQLLALVKAGIVHPMAPGMQVSGADGAFIASDNAYDEVRSNVLIEARLNTTDFRYTASTLFKDLLAEKEIVPNESKQTSSGQYLTDNTPAIDAETYQVMNPDGKPYDNWYLYGIPLEGQKWFNTVIPRPGVNSLIFAESNKIAKEILK
ncbi:FAD/NAD(P)-binding protein [Eupransor demetentiae]|uniref:Uncharacterized NAD(P)/FAD-binding protein YdhS (YdhS) n=1 Tax=Eupransor demetentiae TaxID=3109584 RepID=A0ABM9N558_9LACO|nr:Uncharacterized NAD(P)/FAD-binding protein YdhS (YdhS) [Lactobacillaceae bacterium LMG 33000]